MADANGTESDTANTSEAARRVSKASRWPAVLVTLATILAILSAFSVWARTQALDEDDWVEASSQLLEEPEVQQALATYLVGEVYEQGDVTAALGELLPPNVAGLAAAALRGPLTGGVERVLGSDQLRTLWEDANRVAHRVLVKLVRGDGDVVSTSGGEVALDLKPLVAHLARDFGLSGDRIQQLPEDAGRVVLFEADELEAVQNAARVLDFLAWFLVVVVVALYAAAVYLAVGRRMHVVRKVGWSLGVVGVFVLAGQAIAVRVLVDGLVQNPGNRPVAEVVGLVATGLLRQLGWSALLYGLLIVLFTLLLGEHRWAVATRRALAPALTASTGAIVAGTAVLILLLLWWSPGRVFDSWVTGITLIGLVVGAVATLRAKTQQELTTAA